MKTKRFHVVRGNYSEASSDRCDRWYINDTKSTVIDHRGPGYATRREAEEAAEALERYAHEYSL